VISSSRNKDARGVEPDNHEGDDDRRVGRRKLPAIIPSERLKIRYMTAAIRRLIGRRLLFRGKPANRDARITLLTVDWHSTENVIRLIRSFHKFVDPAGPVVVVQNGRRANNKSLRSFGARCVGFGVNINHGPGLDLGMRIVETEYTLICDPDSAIVGHGFRNEITGRIDRVGAAGVDNGAAFYHPVCIGLKTDTWKTKLFSFEAKWPDWDVAGGLTHALGGLCEEGLIPRTRGAGPPLPSGRAGHVHFIGEVYGDVFTNTYCASRKIVDPTEVDFDGWPRQMVEDYHAAWESWVAAVLSDHARVEDFPASPA